MDFEQVLSKYFGGLLGLCQAEFEAIEREGGKDRRLLKIRMDTIYVNLLSVRRSGYKHRSESLQYRVVKRAFIALQEEHGMCYNDDDL